MKKDPLDPKGLIREAYRIEGITSGECRSIFLDWALSVSDAEGIKAAIQELLNRYADEPGNHPMTEVLTQGLQSAKPAKRRGGWRSRAR